MLKIPAQLKNKIHYDYIDKKYKEGTFIVQGMNDDVLYSVLFSFIQWCEDNNKLKDNCIDISFLIGKD